MEEVVETEGTPIVFVWRLKIMACTADGGWSNKKQTVLCDFPYVRVLAPLVRPLIIPQGVHWRPEYHIWGENSLTREDSK